MQGVIVLAWPVGAADCACVLVRVSMEGADGQCRSAGWRLPIMFACPTTEGANGGCWIK